MTRRAAAVLLVLTLFPAVLYAQDTALTVTVQSADVYKGPSTGTPVIGHAPKGDVLPVVRNLGSWVQVAWVAAPDGIGYVHTTMGRLNIPNGVFASNDQCSNDHIVASVVLTRAGIDASAGPALDCTADARVCGRSSPAERSVGWIADQPHRRRGWHGRHHEQLWRDGTLVAEQARRGSGRTDARCDVERHGRRPRDLNADRAGSGLRPVRSRARLRLDSAVCRIRAEFPSPDVERYCARADGAFVGQWRWISTVRWRRTDFRERDAVWTERGSWLPSSADAVCRIRS